MMATFYSPEEQQQDMFEMDGFDVQEQPAFEMDDEYGFYEDLDVDDDTVAPMAPIPSDDESSAVSIPVCGSRIEDTDRDSLATSPPILSPFMVDTIVEAGLPWAMQDNQWDRLFASSRDGTSFGTFMRRVRGHGQTVIVAKTSDGKIIGGYATDVWSGRKQPASSQDEASHAFLFVVEPPSTRSKQEVVSPECHAFIPGFEEFGTSPTSALDFDFHQLAAPSLKNQDGKPTVEIFRPSQKQPTNAGLKQACQIGNKFISMTDGDGDLSLVIEDSFSRGTTRAQEGSEEFTIVEFEVYGFSED